MEESESLFVDSNEYEFGYSLFVKLLFWLTGPIMVLLPLYDLYKGKIDKAHYEHIAAVFVILLGIACLHAAWRCLGKVTISKEGIAHTRLGRRIYISNRNITSIENRPLMMSLKITGTTGVIYLEKQIQDYSLAYELLFESVPDKLEPASKHEFTLPVVTRTALKHYYSLMVFGACAVAVIAWQLWQVYGGSRLAVDAMVTGLAAGAIIFSVVVAVMMFVKAEFTADGVQISGLWRKTEIRKESIVHLGLTRSYEKETDPAYDLEIEYTKMPLEEAPEDAEVFSHTLSGSLMDIPLEPVFNRLVSVYHFDEDGE